MTETMTAHFLENIPYEPDVPGLIKRLRVKQDGLADLNCLLSEARALARPRALYLAAYINTRGEDWIEVEGIRFSSKVLCVNLAQAYRVFPYLATCGMELQEWAVGIDDMLFRFWAEAIKETALFCALHALSEHIEAHYRPGKTASMNPGSLEDWPIQQQRPLFDLFGSQKNQIGIQLTDSMLMIPTKSVSGIRFPTQVDFESCQLCPREDCPGRRAPYDPELFNNQYRLHNG